MFLKNFLKQTWKPFNTKLRGQWKDPKSSYQERLVSTSFCNLIALILSWSCLKGFRVTEIFKETKFEVIWGKLKAKKILPQTLCKTFFSFLNSLLIASIFKSSHIYCRPLFSFLNYLLAASIFKNSHI